MSDNKQILGKVKLDIKQILGKVKLDITIFSARQLIFDEAVGRVEYYLARRKNSDDPTLPHLIFVLSDTFYFVCCHCFVFVYILSWRPPRGVL